MAMPGNKALLIICLSALLVVAAGCDPPPPTPVPTPATPQEQLEAALQKMQAVTSYHFIRDQLFSNTGPDEVRGDFQGPDKVRVAIEKSDGSLVAELIYENETTYIREASAA